MAEPADPDRQLEELCRVLNYFGVSYIVFGSHVARLNDVPVETVDVDVVPARRVDNLTLLAEALNLLRPRWRVEGIPEGMKIDGGLEARHFMGDSDAIGLLTRLGPVDVVLEPKASRPATPRSSPGRRGCAEAMSTSGSGGSSASSGRRSYCAGPRTSSTWPSCTSGSPTCPRVATRAPRPQLMAVAFRILTDPCHRPGAERVQIRRAVGTSMRAGESGLVLLR